MQKKGFFLKELIRLEKFMIDFKFTESVNKNIAINKAKVLRI